MTDESTLRQLEANIEELYRESGKNWLPTRTLRGELERLGIEPHAPAFEHLETVGLLRRAGRGYRRLGELGEIEATLAVAEGGPVLVLSGDEHQPVRWSELPRFLVVGDRFRVRAEAGRGDRLLLDDVELLERPPRHFEGTIVEHAGRRWIEPLESLGARRIGIAGDPPPEATPGARVQAELLPAGAADPQPQARIVEAAADPDLLARILDEVIAGKNLRTAFPDDVLAEVAALPEASWTADQAAGLEVEDLRDLPLVTIDGASAKDYDDAVWVQRRGEGWEAVVAVADVSRYVREGTALDREAVRRGTSVYFPGRVLPMLPERLSNDLCSLMPQLDRPAVGVRMQFDARGRRTDARLWRGWIRSHARLTYRGVNAWIEDPATPELGEAGPAVHKSLAALVEWTRLRLDVRHERGALDFDLPEPEFVMDLDGDPSGVIHHERGLAQRAVEEMMIAANEASAEILGGADLPILYRCHAEPSPERVEAWRLFAHNIGLRVPRRTSPETFQQVNAAVAGTPLSTAVHVMTLRTMSQAEYRVENIGHFGLALADYCHFTSPIRRYPDLINHRWAVHFLERGGMSRKRLDETRARIRELGTQLTEREKAAEGAERTYVKHLKARVMEGHLGAQFEGTVIGVANFGFFVEPDGLRIEGLVALRDLDDFYIFDEQRLELRGRQSKRRIRLGDRMLVELVSVDVAKGHVDFRWLEHRPLSWSPKDRKQASGEVES